MMSINHGVRLIVSFMRLFCGIFKMLGVVILYNNTGKN